MGWLIDGLTIASLSLLITGFVLIGIEMLAPGISIPGILGSICLVMSVFLIADNIVEGAIITLVILAVLGIMLGIMLWLLSKGKLIKPIILEDEQHKEKGYISSSDLEYLLDKEGTTLTDLRPTGSGDFDGVKFEVISEGDYILKNQPIKIIKVQGRKLIVKQLK